MKIPKACKIELACSTDVTRKALWHPYYDALAGRLLATDGRIMAVIPVQSTEDKPDDSGAITLDALTAGRKLVCKGMPVEIHANGALTLANGASFPRPVDEGFPVAGSNSVIKSSAPSEGDRVIRLTLDFERLKRLVGALGTPGIVLEIVIPPADAVDANCIASAVFVRPSSVSGDHPAEPGAFGIIMPMKS